MFSFLFVFVHDAKISLNLLQMYGKTLNDSRIFPIFYKFAFKI